MLFIFFCGAQKEMWSKMKGSVTIHFHCMGRDASKVNGDLRLRWVNDDKCRTVPLNALPPSWQMNCSYTSWAKALCLLSLLAQQMVSRLLRKIWRVLQCAYKRLGLFFKLLGTPVLFYYYLYIIIIFFYILNKLLFLAYMFSFHFILGFSTFMRFHFLYIGVFKASK